jgi:hypothetical protein
LSRAWQPKEDTDNGQVQQRGGEAINRYNSSSPTRPRSARALRRAHAAAHRFVEQFEAEVEDAVDSARARQLAPIKHIFKRKPLVLRKAGGTAGAATAGPEEAALAALELAGQNLIGHFRGLEQRLAASCTTTAARLHCRRKKNKTGCCNSLADVID